MKKIIKKFRQKFRSFKKKIINPILVRNKPKIFCIGQNKTGTTSLKRAFLDLNFIVGDQRKAEELLRQYIQGDFAPIIEYCKSAQVFQDAPFSYPETYQHLDRAFPGSKFILSVRDSPEQWYNSITKFHAKRFGNGNIPTKENLQKAAYIWEGWMWEANRAVRNTPEDDLYNKEMLMAAYTQQNEDIINYFKDRPNDFIVINVSDKSSYKKLMDFLQIKSPFHDFPWENQTAKLQISRK